jgi:hypothetical protein
MAAIRRKPLARPHVRDEDAAIDLLPDGATP